MIEDNADFLRSGLESGNLSFLAFTSGKVCLVSGANFFNWNSIDFNVIIAQQSDIIYNEGVPCHISQKQVRIPSKQKL